MYNPNMNFNFSRMKFLPKLYHTKRSYFTSKVELLWLIKRQLEITDINFRRIYEDKVNLEKK